MMDARTEAELIHRFSFHPADTKERQDAHAAVRSLCLMVARQLGDHLPDGREKSLALTELEGAMFWANAAIARQKG